MNVGVVSFPGSNCDADARFAASLDGSTVHALWHKDTSVPAGLDLIILPGGFSYGDYLRTGAIARFSPIMHEVVAHAKRGGLVLGICNGFQILTEAGLLPGALIRNASLSFVCKTVHLKVENTTSAFTSAVTKGAVLGIPVAHGDGRYTATDDVLDRLEGENQIVYRYCDSQGHVTEAANPNGSLRNIAGILNAGGNVMGLMPHPERASDAILGSADGLTVFASMAQYVGSHSVEALA
ncbi:MAG: phosphoribosylformylglycinamidine synthase subunit PurQ [bacterium]|nr:phosphoribosylformylglycinamidine synthase subunit PurQ [bacterium]